MAFTSSVIAAFLTKSLDFLRRDYARNQITLDVARYVGWWGHPLYYLICTFILPQPYESAWLRFASGISFIPFFFYKHYPVRFGPWLNLYWYLWLTFTLPIIFTFLMLMNDLSGMWLVAQTMMFLVFPIFVSNFFFMISLLVAGIAIGYLGFVWATGSHLVITTEIIEYMIPIPMAMLCGILFNFTKRRGEVALERNQALQSLAGGIAHEMRNPLGQIRHSLNSIRNQLPIYHPDRPAAALDEASLERIYEGVGHGQMAVKRGIQIIDMILDEIRERPIDPDRFVYLAAARTTQKALDEYGYDSASERGRVRLEAREDFSFRIDETLYIFVLFNLMKNALYYFKHRSEGEIRIRLECGGAHNRVRFRDTGPGIPEQDLGRLFDGFFTAGKQGGTGLGLAYCKRVMQAFGGDITCDSVLGAYTEFTLSFPAVTERELAADQARIIAEARPEFRGKRLLVVDDEPLHHAVVKQHLAPLEVMIDEAANGRRAIELARATPYDLILMDLNMPVMNGYEAAECLRRGEAGADAAATPIVAHTAEPPYIARGKTEKVGMQELVAKPCSQAELIRALLPVLAAGPNAGAGVADTGGLSVLLVDDSAINRDLLALSLTDNAGLAVDKAADGAEAWDLLQTQAYALLITDIRMPVLDGLALTRRIRTSPDARLRRLPIIALSGAAEEEDTAKAAGVDAYRLKTEPVETLLATIGKLLDRVAHPVPDAPPPPADHPPQPGFDLGPATAMLGLSPAKMAELFECFRAEHRETPAVLHQALRAGDTATLRAQAHALKGSAAMVCAEPICKAAEALENACRDNRTGEALEDLTEDLVTALGALLDAQTV